MALARPDSLTSNPLPADGPMDERELVAVIEQAVQTSIGHWGAGWGIAGTGLGTPITRTSLADQRANALVYYERQPFGNEIDGESQVVSSDVFDTVEGMLPLLLRTFTASDDVVEFEPNGKEDEEQAKQQTEVANYVMMRQNNGFLIMYEWFKDALIQNNGIVKYWWDKSQSIAKEEYRGLSETQYEKLLKGEGGAEVELLSDEIVPDTTGLEQREEEVKQAIQTMMQEAQAKQVPPEMIEQKRLEILAASEALPVPPLHDVKVKITKQVEKVCIQTVPPEEFGITPDHKCVSIQGASFCFHKTKKTVSELRQMGCPEDVLERAGSASADDQSIDTTVEALARERFIDQVVATPPAPQESMRTHLVTDCFIKIDLDGDGIDELRHIIKVGQAIWTNDECDHINFACITPIIMPHTWVGMSAAELVMADQFTKSVILRQMLNNLYLTNNPRKAVLSSASGVVQANLDDLMNTRAGGIMREYVQGAIRNEETPFVAAAAFPMLDYIDRQKETRTSVTPYSQGTDADSLNKTARGIQMIQQAGQQRIDMIARIFAETGVKDLMRGITYMLSKYSTKAMTVRLRGKWVDVDPRDWKTQFDMRINVGLGTGNKDAQLAHLDRVEQAQIELIKSGRGYLVTDENIWTLYRKKAEALGFKDPDMFVTDPQTVQKPPPQPNPDLVKIEADSKADQAKIEQNGQLKLLDAETVREVEQIKSRTAIEVARMDIESRERIEAARMKHEAQIKVFESNQPEGGDKKEVEEMKAHIASTMEQERIASAERIAVMQQSFEEWKTQLQEQTKKEIAALQASTTIKTAKMAAKAAKDKPKPNESR